MDLLISHYAQAFHNIAKKKEVLSLVAKEMTYLNNLISGSRKMHTFISSPLLKLNQLKEIIGILQEKLNLSELTAQFLHFLYYQKRLNFLQEICQKFFFFYDTAIHQMEIKIKTDFALNDSQKAYLLTLLQNKFKKNIVLRQEVNPEIKGGMVLIIKDQQLDLSLKGQLEYLAKAMRG